MTGEEEGGHGAEGLATVGDLVLLFLGDVGGGKSRILVGNEYRVIPEASPTGFLPGYSTVHNTFELMDFPIKNKGNNRAEPSPPGCLRVLSLKCFQLGEDFIHILPEILGLSSVAGSIDSRSPAQCLNLQASVIGETVTSFPIENKTGFLE